MARLLRRLKIGEVVFTNTSGADSVLNEVFVVDTLADNSVTKNTVDINKFAGVVKSVVPDGSEVRLQRTGKATMIASAAGATRGEYVFISTITAGRAYSSTLSADGCIGIALTTATSGNPFDVLLLQEVF